MADDMGYETLGVYGGSSYKTPNLDQLANDGMRFDHCYSTPLCTPSRVQIMTGKYNFRNYIGFGLLDPDAKTFGHYLKDEGYSTFIGGKWQLLGNEHQQKLAGGKVGTTPEKAGFDDFCLWQIDQRGSRYKDPLLSTNTGLIKFEDKFGPDIFVDYIEKFMDENKEGPMFIYYPMVLTHDPFIPTPENLDFDGFDATAKVNDTLYFGEMVQYMDKLVGRIMQKVETLGIEDNTLLLFVGDNGTDRDVTSLWNGTSITGNKGYTTDAGTHVPLIAHWKGKIKKGSINDNLIDFTDFLPTFMEVATAKALDHTQTDGVSFYPQLLGNNDNTRDWIFCHYEPNWGNFNPRRYVQNNRWKLYGHGEFYDLENDILEQNPLDTGIQNEEVQTILKQFQEVLSRYQK
jgi:arylsulfatase A-like enzyme